MEIKTILVLVVSEGAKEIELVDMDITKSIVIPASVTKIVKFVDSYEK